MFTHYGRSSGDVWRDVYFLGLEDFDQQQVNKVALIEGRWPGRGEVVFETSIRQVVPLRVGQEITREQLLLRLVDLQYNRNDIDFSRGNFRVRPAWRFGLFGNFAGDVTARAHAPEQKAFGLKL